MAEINIRKKKRPVWPWILGILAIIFLSIVLINRDDRGGRSEEAIEVEADKTNVEKETEDSLLKER